MKNKIVNEGIVQSYRPERGYGFLFDEDGTVFFVHATEVPADQRPLRPGQRVRFEIVPGIPGKNDCAINVRVLED